jgi:hypothetical protein
MVDISCRNDAAGIDSLIASYPVMHINDRIGTRAYNLLKTYPKSHGLTLVTKNRRHFGMIDGIRLQVPEY